MVIQYSTASSSFYASEKYRAFAEKCPFLCNPIASRLRKRYEMEEKDEERWNPRLLKRRIEGMRKGSATWW